MISGLKNEVQTFQRFIDMALEGLKAFYVCNITNILIASKDEQEHGKHLKQVFQRLRKYGFSINLDRCVFGHAEVEYLGYTVSREGIKPLKDKV